MLSAKPTLTLPGPLARIACTTKAVAQDRVMPHLVQPGVVQPQPGRAAQVNHLAAPDP